MRKLIVGVLTVTLLNGPAASGPQNKAWRATYAAENILNSKGKLTARIHRLLLQKSTPSDSTVLYTWSDSSTPAEVILLRITADARGNKAIINDTAIEFIAPQEISVGNDVYQVTTAYFAYLKQRVLHEKSIDELAFLLRDGLSDDCSELAGLTAVKWKPAGLPAGFKILQVRVTQQSTQSDHIYHWNAVYNYAKDGLLNSVTGDRYTLNLVERGAHQLKYKIEREFDKNSLSALLWRKRTSAIDSSRISWFQHGTGQETIYTSYQAAPVTIFLPEQPVNLAEAIRLLRAHGLKLGE